MAPRVPPEERNWLVLPIPLFAVRDIIYVLAQETWAGRGGLPPFRIRSLPALEAVLAEPFQTAFGRELYPGVVPKAASLFRGLIQDHPLVDGNKRLAVTTVSVFLELNGRVPTFSDLQLLRYALRIARHHGPYALPAVEAWLRRHSRFAAQADRERQRSRILELRAVTGDFVQAWFVQESRGMGRTD